MNKKSILLGLTLALVGCLPMGTSLAADTPHFKSNKAAAEYFWNEVFNKHDTAVIDTMVGPKYKQHSPLAKGFAFKFLVTPGKSSPLAMTLAVSSCMVVPMVIIMSLYGACEGLTHMPGGILANLYSVPTIWMINIPHNFVMALPWNLLVAGPISHFLFRRAFPVGTVFEEEHAELLEQAMAPECE